MKRIAFAAAAAAAALGAFATAKRPSVVKGRFRPNYDESKVAPYTLEDPLAFADGRKVRGPEDWPARRREIVDLFAREMYGREPPPPETVECKTMEEGVTLAGFAIRRQVRMWFRKDRSGPHIDWLLILPRHAKGPVPAIIGLNYHGNHEMLADPQVAVPDCTWLRNGDGVTDHKPTEKHRGRRCDQRADSILPAAMLVARGYAVMTACYGQVSPDPVWNDRNPADRPGNRAWQGVFELWGARDPSATDGISSFGAWAWALSRGLDLAERTGEIDARRTVATGYSRLAKSALLAASRDERFAVCVPVQCGAGGVQLLKRDFGETVAIINRAFPHWFCRAYAKYADNEENMPFDQHLMIATIAPRGLLVLGFDDPWYDTKGEWLSCKAASPAWEILGRPGLPGGPFPAPYETRCIGPSIGYAHRTEKHGISAWDWTQILDFADNAFGRGRGR